MENLTSVEIKAFIPAKDFVLSQQFYTDLGFTKASEGGGVAYFHHQSCSFLLHDFFDEQLAHQMTMHLLVENAHAWHNHILKGELVERYNVQISDVVEQPWRMLDFVVSDPSGVQWRIGQTV